MHIQPRGFQDFDETADRRFARRLVRETTHRVIRDQIHQRQSATERFRQLTRVARGEDPPQTILDVQELYDTWFLSSPEWEAAQGAR